MKKILFTLVALCATMSINAQTIKIYQKGELVATYINNTDLDYKVVCQETPLGIGSALRNGDVAVVWVQLWENGPKFAEYNIGAADNKAEDYGNYYTWGGSQDKVVDDYSKGSESLSGNNDTATKLWGSNWRMPTKAEFDDLLNNCTCVWTENYNNKGVNGLLLTGKGAYESNSVFLPAAGGYTGSADIYNLSISGYYWSSTMYTTQRSYCLDFNVNYKHIDGNYYRSGGCSVRAVLNE